MCGTSECGRMCVFVRRRERVSRGQMYTWSSKCHFSGKSADRIMRYMLEWLPQFNHNQRNLVFTWITSGDAASLYNTIKCNNWKQYYMYYRRTQYSQHCIFLTFAELKFAIFLNQQNWWNTFHMNISTRAGVNSNRNWNWIKMGGIGIENF